MPRRPCLFRQSDVTRAVRAAQAAGLNVVRVEVDHNGRIAVVAGTGQTDHNAASTINEWDDVLAA
jgi:hypothetical protein